MASIQAKACVGYKNIKYEVDGKEFKTIVPDPDRKGYIIKAFELRLDGKSFSHDCQDT